MNHLFKKTKTKQTLEKISYRKWLIFRTDSIFILCNNLFLFIFLVSFHSASVDDSPLLVLKYCKPLYTEKMRICEKNEVTMSFQGSSLILSNVANVYCRCPEHGPIFLSSSITKGVTKIENYTCFMVSNIQHQRQQMN